MAHTNTHPYVDLVTLTYDLWTFEMVHWIYVNFGSLGIFVFKLVACTLQMDSPSDWKMKSIRNAVSSAGRAHNNVVATAC